MTSAYADVKDVKRCYKCDLDKPVGEFSRNSQKPDGYQSECKTCRDLLKVGKKRGPQRKPRVETAMLGRARTRARRIGLPCDITLEDIVVPEFCPVLGIRLMRSVGIASPGSPTIDRIIPRLGYVKGNIQVISNRANAMKNDASPDELLRFAQWVISNART